MTRRPASKIIHYVRVTYNANTAPKQSFEVLLRRAMRVLGSMAETEVTIPKQGVVSIRNRKLKTDSPILLAIAAGVPGESMATVGIKVAAVEDADNDSPPPDMRAFKLSDAFLLIEQSDILLITDGQFRAGSVEVYLRMLLEKGGIDPQACAFGLKKVANQDKKKVLEVEGIKEMRINTTMYRATQELDQGSSSKLSGHLKGFVTEVKNLFSQEAESNSQQDLQRLSENWDQLQVSTVIKAEGGSKAEEIVLKTIEAVGTDVLDESPDALDVTVVTRKGTKIRLSEVTPIKKVNLRRRKSVNELVQLEVYTELEKYRNELIAQKGWMK